MKTLLAVLLLGSAIAINVVTQKEEQNKTLPVVANKT